MACTVNYGLYTDSTGNTAHSVPFKNQNQYSKAAQL